MEAARVNIIYESKDISRDLRGLVESFTYTDKTAGESDEIELVLKNDDLRWMGNWKPRKKDHMSAEIVDEQGNVLKCGSFTVDNLSGGGGRDSGDTFTIKALAAPVDCDIRTKRTTAHENKTLREIANKIASRNGLTVSGISKDIKIQYVAQYKQTDLAFLHALSLQYGYVFNVRGKQLIFTLIKELHAADAVQTIGRKDGFYSFNEKLSHIYTKAQLRHRHASSNALISGAASTDNDSSDTLVLNDHVENEQQADEVAGSRLYRHNLEQIEMSISELKGNVYLVAGNVVTHEGFESYDGRYAIKESTHTVTRDGSYRTNYTANKL